MEFLTWNTHNFAGKRLILLGQNFFSWYWTLWYWYWILWLKKFDIFRFFPFITCDPLCHSALSSRLSLCHLIINKMFWHLLSLFAAATPTCATPRQSLKRCLKAICIFESRRRRRRWFFNQSTRVSCLAVVNVFPACSSPFAPGVPGELFYCRRSFGLMRGRRAEHESRLIYLNVFECEATSLFLSLSLPGLSSLSQHILQPKRGRQRWRY